MHIHSKLLAVMRTLASFVLMFAVSGCASGMDREMSGSGGKADDAEGGEEPRRGYTVAVHPAEELIPEATEESLLYRRVTFLEEDPDTGYLHPSGQGSCHHDVSYGASFWADDVPDAVRIELRVGPPPPEERPWDSLCADPGFEPWELSADVPLDAVLSEAELEQPQLVGEADPSDDAFRLVRVACARDDSALLCERIETSPSARRAK